MWRWSAPRRRAPSRSASAEEVGRGLAQAGAIVITGGRGGVMAAASRGAAQAGGTVVGILPGEDRGRANQWVESPFRPGSVICATA